MNCDEVQQETSVALLTHASVSDEVARHNAVCPACAAAKARLLPLGELLSSVSLEDLAAPDASTAPADELLLQRTLAAVRRERQLRQRRHRRQLLGLAAAAVVLLIGAIVVPRLTAASPQVIRATASGGGIHATATVAAAGDGSTVAMSINGVPADTWCVLTVQDTDGSTHLLSRWKVDYEGTATVTGKAPAAPGDIDRIVISSDAGIPLLEIPVAA